MPQQLPRKVFLVLQVGSWEVQRLHFNADIFIGLVRASDAALPGWRRHLIQVEFGVRLLCQRTITRLHRL